MQYNKVGEIMYKVLIVEDDELISKKLESFLICVNISCHGMMNSSQKS